MLRGFAVLVLFQIAGDVIRHFTGLPVPGPVIGMALLLAALVATARLPDVLDRTANGILSYLPMLFVPAGVGVMAHLDLIRTEWPAITVAITLSSVFAVIVTAATMQGLERLQRAITNARRRRIKQVVTAR